MHFQSSWFSHRSFTTWLHSSTIGSSERWERGHPSGTSFEGVHEHQQRILQVKSRLLLDFFRDAHTWQSVWVGRAQKCWMEQIIIYEDLRYKNLLCVNQNQHIMKLRIYIAIILVYCKLIANQTLCIYYSYRCWNIIDILKIQ